MTRKEYAAFEQHFADFIYHEGLISLNADGEIEMIEIRDEVKGVNVVSHEREYTDGYDASEEVVWDTDELEDSRRCVYRNGFFWEWLDREDDDG
jgi:hypothetical protein